ncbi:Pre-mRNA-splicing factor SPF27 [Paraphysoderma sedebokerense]|nr:Pre-mRNA-splicing factor SPF27 [Paraphysoderma sedebokerense]
MDLLIVGMKETVDSLIKSEMRKMTKPDYVESGKLPREIELFQESPMLLAELQTAESGVPMEKLDLTRYNLEPPKESTLESWKRAYDNSLAQLESQKNRIMNLELLQKYGSNAWLYRNYQLEKLLALVQKNIDEAKEAVLEVNKKRKMDQLQTQSTLFTLSTRYNELLSSVVQVETACAGLEAEIEVLRGLKEKSTDGGNQSEEGDKTAGR